jgi:catechol 2,3-dioxygenase-like lactoylglutathione lyase family enzyme
MGNSVRYVHTNIVARDWRRLARFYIEVFGCRIAPPERDLKGSWLDRLTTIRGARVRGAHLALPGFAKDGPTLEIFQYPRVSRSRAARSKPLDSKPAPVDAPGLRHLAFSVRNVNAVVASVEEKGGGRVGEIVSARVGGVGTIEVVYARDPEGNIIEIQKWT